MSFLNFYKKWFFIILSGWFQIIKIIYKIFIEFIFSLPFSLWKLYLVSFSVLIFVFFPWFRYQIHLENLTTEMIRSKKWYLFIIPPFFSILITLLIYKPYYYIFQLGINIIIILIYIYGLINHKIHILVEESYEMNFVFYLYFVALIFHTIFIVELKKPLNYVPYYILKIWNEKRKNFL